MRAPRVLLLAALLCAAPLAAETVEVRDFELHKNGEDVLLVELHEPGLVVVRVHIREPLARVPVQLTLQGPDGVRVEKEGSAPLQLKYALEGRERLGTWRVVVKNHAKLPVLAGKVQVDFEPSPSPAPSVAETPPPSPSTDGKIVYPEDDARIRAVCRDKNQDVVVRIDMTSGQGAFYMGYHRVFHLEASYRSNDVVELRGGEVPFFLDLDKKVIYFADDDAAVFCRVRIYRGVPLD